MNLGPISKKNMYKGKGKLVLYKCKIDHESSCITYKIQDSRFKISLLK